MDVARTRVETNRTAADAVDTGVDSGASDAAVDHAAGVRGTGVAVGVSAVSALLVALSPVLGAATAVDGTERAGSVPAAVVAAALAGLVPGVALLLLRRGRLAGAAGLLAGAAAVSLGLAVLDVQLFSRALDANRLELFRPVTAAELAAGPGAVAVLVGHLGAVVAGAVALRTVRSSGVLDEPDDVVPAGPSSGGGRTGTLLAALAGLALAGSLFAAPLTSTDPVVLVRPVLQGPVATVVGTALVAVGVLVAVALALTASSGAAAAGTLVGVGVAALALVAPRWAAGAELDRFGASTGAVVGTLAALVLVGVGAAASEVLRRGPRGGTDRRERAFAAERELPGLPALHRTVQATGVLAGLLAVAAALLPVLDTADGRAGPGIDAVRVLLLAGVLLAAVCVGMVGELAGTLRPVVGVLWTAVLLGGGGVLQAVLVATTVPGVGWGAGAVLTVLAGSAATACGAAAGLAGSAERDDIDTSDTSTTQPPERALLVLGGAAALVAVAGLGLPLYSAPGFTSSGLLTGSWGWDTWALAVAAVAVVVATGTALRARPSRGSALGVGTALLLVVHLASWPLTSGRVVGAGMGAGAPFAAVGVVLLVAVAVLLGRRTRPRGGARRGR